MSHSFEIKFDKKFEPDNLTIRANFSEMPGPEEKKAFMRVVLEWCDKDFLVVVHVDEEAEWHEGPEGIWAEIYSDLQQVEDEGELYPALDMLWDRLDVFPQITSVMVGSGYESWPFPPEEE